MKRIVVCGLLTMVLSGIPLVAGEAKSKGKGKAPGGPPSQAEMEQMMKAFEEMAKPGKEHRALETRVGMWTTATKYAMGPGQPLSGESPPGSNTVKPMFDGRFFVEELQGSFMGRPFKGHGIMGFDKFRKEYNMMWIDNMGTAMLTAAGKFDKSGKVLTLIGKMDDPMTGEKNKTVRYVYRFESKDRIVFQMWDHPKMKGAKPYIALEVTYTRKS